jgi:hypothetical protein|tara:strand:+ start:226 stop:552 length:327 start_codon:yes stop_codon:yes gene_type:complete
MEELGNDAVLFDGGIPLWVDVDLDVDQDGVLNIVIDLTVDEFDEITIKRPMFEIVEGILSDGASSYQMLYTIANELMRESEKLREKAQRVEDSTTNVSDLFDADYDPT